MNIKEARSYFEGRIVNSNNKSEIQVYQKFVSVFSSLLNKNLSQEYLNKIEEELDKLNLKVNPNNNYKYYHSRLTQFIKYLKKEFSFITEGYFTGIGISLGISLGIALGVSVQVNHGLIYGLIGGLLVGMLLGMAKDARLRKQNRVIKMSVK